MMRRIKIGLMLAMVALMSGVCYAETLTLAASYLSDKNYTVVADMPCNWNSDMDKVQLIAYYGETGETLYQAGAPYLTLMPAGQNLVISFDKDKLMAHPETDQPLHHVDIEFKTTNKKCPTGFGFSGTLTK